MSQSTSVLATPAIGAAMLKHRRTNVDELAESAMLLNDNEKAALLCRILQMMSGDRLERELMLADEDGFVYAHIISPGVREYFRRLERGESPITEVDEATYPLDQVRQELGIRE